MENNGPETTEPVEAQLFAHARAVPAGRVISYGALGALCEPPISGYICGRILGRAGEDVPWWRVVGKDGALPIRKRAPHLEERQRATLEAEGVAFDAENCIEMERFAWKSEQSESSR